MTVEHSYNYLKTFCTPAFLDTEHKLLPGSCHDGNQKIEAWVFQFQ